MPKGSSVSVMSHCFERLALARRQFTSRVCWWELSRSVMVARFGERESFRESCWPERGQSVSVARFEEGGFRESCVGGRQVAASVLVARLGEKDVPDRLRR